MRIRVDIDNSLSEKELVIRTPEMDSEVNRLMALLKQFGSEKRQLILNQGVTEYYIDLQDILFFQTENRQIQAHTATESFETHYRLYELERLLPTIFMRVSKSTILNVGRIHALTHSVSTTIVAFADSYKEVYVSRKYYRALKQRLEEAYS